MANTGVSERSESSDESAMDLRPSLGDKDEILNSGITHRCRRNFPLNSSG